MFYEYLSRTLSIIVIQHKHFTFSPDIAEKHLRIIDHKYKNYSIMELFQVTKKQFAFKRILREISRNFPLMNNLSRIIHISGSSRIFT